jgi:hypothetical protein
VIALQLQDAQMAKAKQEKDEHRTQILVAMIAAAGVVVAGALGTVGSLVSNKPNGLDLEGTTSVSPTAAANTDYLPTTVYVTSVSTTNAPSAQGIQNRESVTWRFTGTVKPPPGGRGVVFVLGKTEDGSRSINSDPVSIAFDGAWVAVVGPIPRDLAWTMKWVVAYGEIAAGDSGDTGGPRVRHPGDAGGPSVGKRRNKTGAKPNEPGAPYEPGAPNETAGAPNETAGAPSETAGAPNEPGGAPSETAGAPNEPGGAPSETDGFQRKAVTDVPKKLLPPKTP